jgi:hypothetical protein
VRCEECGGKLPRQTQKPPTLDEDEDEQRPPRASSAESEERRPRRRPPEDYDEEEEEEYERRPRRPRYEDDEEEDEAISIIIPYKNPRALASYYMSFFTLIPVIGIIIGLAAIILGVLGLRYTGAHRKAKGTAHSLIGICLSTICIVANPFISYMLYQIYWPK